MRTNDAQMLTLFVLADGPLHGYGINTAIEKLTGARLGRGSLSGALARLEAKGLIERMELQGRQLPFRLTLLGQETLELELASTARVAEQLFETAVPDRVGYQDRLAATEFVQSYKQLAVEALAVRPGQAVLDLGCGPGTDLAALAEAVTPSGAVFGIDSGAEMLDRARARTTGLPQVSLQRGDIHALPYAEGSFDRAHTDRVLQHVADPAGVLAEVRRVLRPGGRLVMAEPDWETLAVDHPELQLSRAYTRHIAERIVRNGALGRQSARLAVDAGFTVSAVLPVVSVFRDVREADQVLGLRRNTERAVAAGYFRPDEAERWLAHLTEGPFLASATLYLTVVDVPAEAGPYNG
ncbi:methyltransferase domain-containing protein [Streptacidiphilus carbonis]|uniref:methyltransferase domain-containing protein n=1 Tax=Streptacidiphilus carbonis TaxID=105422 RepID=UPI0005AB638F|nr:methyltransferase domain-containing protein [Streptacidiphilus carbonis]